VKLRSVRFKVSVLYTSVLGAILLVYSLMLYFNLGYSLSRAIDSDLRKKVLEIEETTNLYSQAFDTTQEKDVISVRRALHINEMADREAFQWPSVRKIDQSWRYRIQALGIKHDYVVVYSSSGEVLETSQNVDEELLSILKALFHTTLKVKRPSGTSIQRNTGSGSLPIPFTGERTSVISSRSPPPPRRTSCFLRPR